MKAKFYLKNYKARNKSAIYLDFSYNGFRLQTSIGISIAPCHWSKKASYPKSQIENYDVYREYLEKIRNAVERFYLEEKSRGTIPHPLIIKGYLDKELSLTKLDDKRTDFLRFYDEYLESKSLMNAPATIQILKTVLKDLIEFSSKHKIDLTFENINKSFYEKYLKYLLEKKNTNANCLNKIGFVNDTIAKRIACIKNYMRWAEERNYHNNKEYRSFKYSQAKKNENVTLSVEEFRLIRDFELSGNKKLERIRDLFMFGIYTGQRWSDISKFDKKDLVGDCWRFVAFKTKTKVIEVPFVGFSEKGLEILKKYNYELPKISGQKFNQYLKELGKLVGIDEEVILRRFSGKRLIELRYPKYELMSSHMARRTSVTLMLQSKIPPTTVMKLTGHSDLKTLLKYENTSIDALKESLTMMNID